jgi:hypothetical protein
LVAMFLIKCLYVDEQNSNSHNFCTHSIINIKNACIIYIQYVLSNCVYM